MTEPGLATPVEGGLRAPERANGEDARGPGLVGVPPPSVSSSVPSNVEAYLASEYWDARFEQEESYEWLGDYAALRPRLLSMLDELAERSGSGGPRFARVLVVGNGNSSMGRLLAHDAHLVANPGGVVLTDIAPNAAMRSLALRGTGGQGETSSSREELCTCDMLALPFRAGSFDLVIEKGAMDVLECDAGDDAWNPNEATVSRMRRWLDEAHRVLAPNGVIVSMSFQQPHFRRPLYDAQGFSWRVTSAAYSKAGGEGDGGGGFWDYFMYAGMKGVRDPSEPAVGLAGGTTKREWLSSESMDHEHMDDENFLLGIGD